MSAWIPAAVAAQHSGGMSAAVPPEPGPHWHSRHTEPGLLQEHPTGRTPGKGGTERHKPEFHLVLHQHGGGQGSCTGRWAAPGTGSTGKSQITPKSPPRCPR